MLGRKRIWQVHFENFRDGKGRDGRDDVPRIAGYRATPITDVTGEAVPDCAGFGLSLGYRAGGHNGLCT